MEDVKPNKNDRKCSKGGNNRFYYGRIIGPCYSDSGCEETIDVKQLKKT